MNLLKAYKNNVHIVEINNKKFVKTNTIDIINTQIKAVEFYAKNNTLHIITSCKLPDKNTISPEHPEGTPPLIKFDDKKMSTEWWIKIITQIQKFLNAIHINRANYNDFWDNNITVNENAQIKIIDYEYVTIPGFLPKSIRSALRKEKIKMG